MALKRALPAVLAACALLVGAGAFLYATNRPPVVPPVTAVDAADPEKPFVVKLHAQWCPKCMVTRSVWSQVEAAYATRVKLVVFDFTHEAGVAAGGKEASRLGLDSFFDEYSGATGLVVVLDGRTREVLSVIGGSRDFDDYRAAIDAALGSPRPSVH